jgi:hypothetical protein
LRQKFTVFFIFSILKILLEKNQNNPLLDDVCVRLNPENKRRNILGIACMALIDTKKRQFSYFDSVSYKKLIEK